MGSGDESGLARGDEDAARLAAAAAVREALDRSAAAAEAKMEILAKAEPFIEAEDIAANAKITVQREGTSGVAMGDTRNP